MSDVSMLLLGLLGVRGEARDRDAPSVVPEPEFKPFKLPSRQRALPAPARAQGEAGPAANTTLTPRTLEELGVPRTLAAELEASLRVMGRVDGDRIVGFTYRTPDGVAHPLRAETAVGGASSGRAA